MRITLALLLLVAPAFAEVADSSPNGFTIKISMTLPGAPGDVYRKLVHNVGDWWSSSHTFSGNAHNLSLEEKAMGCFCENLPGRGAVRHMEVVRYETGKVLVMSGALGPMQGLGAAGNLTIQFAPADGGTKMDVTYAVGGYLAAGLNTFANPANGMLTDQFTRFKNYVEGGAK